MSNVEVVVAAFEAYRSQDRATAEPLYAEDFTFTSPQDDHIDRGAFFDRCFPTAGRMAWQRTVELVEGEHGVVVLYEYELTSGERYRNAEYIRVRDGQLVATQVFFGGRVG